MTTPQIASQRLVQHDRVQRPVNRAAVLVAVAELLQALGWWQARSWIRWRWWAWRCPSYATKSLTGANIWPIMAVPVDEIRLHAVWRLNRGWDTLYPWFYFVLNNWSEFASSASARVGGVPRSRPAPRASAPDTPKVPFRRPIAISYRSKGLPLRARSLPQHPASLGFAEQCRRYR